MVDRIKKNEERFDEILKNIKDLEESLEKFKSNQKNIQLVNQYYGSEEWFLDKDNYEKHKIENVKAGILGEDSVWNMNEDISDLMELMRSILEYYQEKKQQ